MSIFIKVESRNFFSIHTSMKFLKGNSKCYINHINISIIQRVTKKLDIYHYELTWELSPMLMEHKGN